MVFGLFEKKEQETQQENEEFRPDFQGSFVETPIELFNNIIEPAGSQLYENDKVYEQVADNQFREIIRSAIKILRDLPLGNFNEIDEAQVQAYLEIAEHLDDMEMYEASIYYVRLAYQLVNLSRGRKGFLQKQIGTRTAEVRRIQGTEKKGGIFSRE